MLMSFDHLRENGALETRKDQIRKILDHSSFIVVFIVKDFSTFSEWTWEIRCVTRT